MPAFPLQLGSPLASWTAFLAYLAIGFAFGFVLEIAGFGHSPKLAAQFYFKDLTVLKVMFTAIVVAMVLIFFASGLGLLNYNLIWVNPTYLWPGIVGGLVMGVGFILGGFCPGTSLVAAATGRIDGIFFVLGGLFGMFVFGETVGSYETWWVSSYMGRFTLPELFNVSTGVVVVGVVLMALAMFAFAEFMEKVVGGRDLKAEPKLRFAAAGGLLAVAIAVLVIQQPVEVMRKEAQAAAAQPGGLFASANLPKLPAAKQAKLDQREVQIHPAELLTILNDRKLNVVMLDVRPEADYNLFHIEGAQHVSDQELFELKDQFQYNPPNTVYVLMSNDEKAATYAWAYLTAESLPNLYLLEGGINNWLTVFGEGASYISACPGNDEDLRYQFSAALGSSYSVAYPHLEEFKIEFTPKVKLDLKKGPTKGGCG